MPTTTPASRSASLSWTEEMIARMADGKVDIPMVPAVAARVIEMVQNDSATLHGVAEVVQNDQVVASKLLKMANTMMYSGRHEISSVNQAIVRLGFAEVRNIVTSITLGSTLSNPGIYGNWGSKLQEHSIGVAYTAQAVAEEVGGDPQLAFMCGLFHDLGKLILLKLRWDIEQETGKLGHPEELDQLIDHYHAGAGGLILRRWNLPANVEDAIRHHHDPAGALTAPVLARVVYLADQMSHVLGFGCESEARSLATDPYFIEMGIGSEWIDQQREILPERIEVALKLFFR